MSRTPAYWPTRIMLAVGIVSTLAIVLFAVTGFGAPEPCFSCAPSSVLGLPSTVVYSAVTVGIAVVGLVWMVRIFRGPRDEPPAWRYHDND